MSKPLLTKEQREREVRDRRMYEYFVAERAKGSAKMLIYEKLASRYGIKSDTAGKICRRYERARA